MKIEVQENVTIPGSFNGEGNNMLHVDVKLTFDIPPAHFSSGMTFIVLDELQKAIIRLINKAKEKK
jgi:hypothetical protein